MQGLNVSHLGVSVGEGGHALGSSRKLPLWQLIFANIQNRVGGSSLSHFRYWFGADNAGVSEHGSPHFSDYLVDTVWEVCASCTLDCVGVAVFPHYQANRCGFKCARKWGSSIWGAKEIVFKNVTKLKLEAYLQELSIYR